MGSELHTARIGDSVSDRESIQTDFHSQRARPIGIIFVIVGLIGVLATLVFATDSIARFALTFLFGGFLSVGAPGAIVGGYFRIWFTGGRVYWKYPSRLYGKEDSCAVSDIVRFERIIKSAGVDSSWEVYRLVLKDGTKKRINDNCFGDSEAFSPALQRQNPSIKSMTLYETDLVSAHRIEGAGEP